MSLVMTNMFNHSLFLSDHFGTPDDVVGALSAYRMQTPSRDRVRKWFERGGIPSTWLPLLLCVLELEHGRAPGLAKYIKSVE